MRGSGNGRHTTIADHMPSSHRRYADWTVERIRRKPGQSARYGDAVRDDPGAQAASRTGLPFLPGNHALPRPFGADRLEAAALRAIEIGTRLRSVRSILEKKLDRQAAQPRPAEAAGPPPQHPRFPLLP